LLPSRGRVRRVHRGARTRARLRRREAGATLRREQPGAHHRRDRRAREDRRRTWRGDPGRAHRRTVGDRAAARGLPGRELGGQPGRGRGVHPSPPDPERAVRRVRARAHRSQPARLNDGGPPVDIQMPQLGETVTEGTITRWLKSVGDHVDADEPLFEVSTDKVDSEVPAPASGTLSEILVQEGATAEVGTRLAVISDGAGPAPTSGAPPQASAGGQLMSPVVRRLLNEYGLDAGEVEGSGEGGRITRNDVLDAASRRQDGTQGAAPTAPAPAAPAPSAPAPAARSA